MSIATILDAVRDLVLDAGTPETTTHDGIRWAAQESDFLALFRDPDDEVVHGWMCTRRGASERIVGTNNLSIITHNIRVIGFYAVKDQDGVAEDYQAASEATFRTVTDAVLAALRETIVIGDAYHCGPPQIAVEEHRMIQQVLCHYVEIALPARERLSYVG